ncbi:MAG: HD domain-containing protein [Acidimicrobiia bacterium]|nr:HD domain-containing protein [Acidimicrobiia bacterium]
MFNIKRAKVLHHVLLVLMVVSIAPLGFYGYQLIQFNREKLQTQERFSQIGIAQSLARLISLHLSHAREQVEGVLESSLDLSGGRELELENNRGLEKKLEDFVGRSRNLLYINIVNNKGRGVEAGVHHIDEEGMTKHFLAKAFQSASQNQTSYVSEPLTIELGKETEPVIIMSSPLKSGEKGIGAVTVILKLDDILRWVTETSVAGKTVYVVDFNGQIVVHPNPKTMPAGMDLSRVEIVAAFVDEWRKSKGKVRLQETRPFKLTDGGLEKQMLGTYFAVAAEAPWGVIVQIDQRDAFATVAEMKAETIRWGALMLLLAGGVGVLSARAITNPIQQLAESTHSIARGDFSKKIEIRSRTEIGELAETFNKMTDDLELYIRQIRKAGEANKALFLGTIRALAAAVDEKDPYTRGHSDRVTKYSVIIARALGLDERTVETISISALLHDVGKIGIDDRILKKPGFLTPEEFEVMKQHPVKGFSIMKTIEQMRNVLPGLRSHHEQWDGNGYPDRLKGEEIPLIARIIAVADTLDAMTTNRPYQQALTFQFAVEKINKNIGLKYDKKVVGAFNRAIEQGQLVVEGAVPESLAG